MPDTVPVLLPIRQVFLHTSFLARGRLTVCDDDEWWDRAMSSRLCDVGLKLNGREWLLGFGHRC